MTGLNPTHSARSRSSFVSDIQTSCHFYRDKLGFDVALLYGEPPFFCQVRRNGAKLNLRHVSAPVIDHERRDKEDLLSAVVALDDAKPLFLEYQIADVTFHQSLRTEPWGARTFIVRDPDGNLVLCRLRALSRLRLRKGFSL